MRADMPPAMPPIMPALMLLLPSETSLLFSPPCTGPFGLGGGLGGGGL